MKTLILLISILLTGCTHTTTIYKEGKEVMKFKHSSDAVVKYKDKDAEGSVDDRGRPSLIEQMITAPLMTDPKVVIGDD